jgi:hypothetical protein
LRCSKKWKLHEVRMNAKMTVTEMLDTLRGQIDFHRGQETFHAQQEIHHREEKARHAADLAEVTQHFTALQAAVAGAEQVLRVPEPPPQPAVQAPDDSDLGERPKASQAFARVLAGWAAGVAFGPKAFAAEVGRRFPGKLRGQKDARAASLYLRRRLDEGRLESVREGRAHHEALYRKPV